MRSRVRPAALGPLAPQLLLAALGIAVLIVVFPGILPPLLLSRAARLQRVESCALKNFRAGDGLASLGSVAPIAAGELVRRRDRLARELVAADVDAFVAEPGDTFEYYTSISRGEWNRHGPRTGPILMAIAPRRSARGVVTAETAFLVPKYEEAHAQHALNISHLPNGIITWAEADGQRPYEVLLEVLLNSSSLAPRPSSSAEDMRSKWHGESTRASAMLDAELRASVAWGLAQSGFYTAPQSQEVVRLRQIKSAAEVAILRAADTATVGAMRAVRPCLSPRLTESEVQDVLGATLESAGLERGFEDVLFDEHGTVPHGGAPTGGKTLKADSMVTMSAGTRFMGYYSTVARSFLPDPPKALWPLIVDPTGNIGVVTGLPGLPLMPEVDYGLLNDKLKAWDVLSDARVAAAAVLQAYQPAEIAEDAGMKVIGKAGSNASSTEWPDYGVNIIPRGIPYQLDSGNETVLEPGMVVDMHLGIRVDGKFGVSLQDAYLITETGEANLLTGHPAGGLYDP